MPNELTTTSNVSADVMEQVIAVGDLSKLTPAQRVNYYRAMCDSLGLNWVTKPFEYITLNGKLTLYARKDAADQLRRKHGVSIGEPRIQFEEDWIIVTVVASINGRTDSDIGVVSKKDMRGDFGNALMKAVTKAKRRVTLSICGLGMLDETEIETIPDARPVVVTETGEIVKTESKQEAKPAVAHWTKFQAEREAFGAWREKLSLSDSDCKRLAGAYGGKPPLALFSEYPGTRLELQNAIEAQIAREQAVGKLATDPNAAEPPTEKLSF